MPRVCAVEILVCTEELVVGASFTVPEGILAEAVDAIERIDGAFVKVGLVKRPGADGTERDGGIVDAGATEVVAAPLTGDEAGGTEKAKAGAGASGFVNAAGTESVVAPPNGVEAGGTEKAGASASGIVGTAGAELAVAPPTNVEAGGTEKTGADGIADTAGAEAAMTPSTGVEAGGTEKTGASAGGIVNAADVEMETPPLNGLEAGGTEKAGASVLGTKLTIGAEMVVASPNGAEVGGTEKTGAGAGGVVKTSGAELEAASANVEEAGGKEKAGDGASADGVVDAADTEAVAALPTGVAPGCTEKAGASGAAPQNSMEAGGTEGGASTGGIINPYFREVESVPSNGAFLWSSVHATKLPCELSPQMTGDGGNTSSPASREQREVCTSMRGRHAARGPAVLATTSRVRSPAISTRRSSFERSNASPMMNWSSKISPTSNVGTAGGPSSSGRIHRCHR